MIGDVPKMRYVSRALIPGDGAAALLGKRRAYFTECPDGVETPIYARHSLSPGDSFDGPAIVQEPDATVVIPPEHRLSVDSFGNLVIAPHRAIALGA
jgi:N-methylhydantoinase A